MSGPGECGPSATEPTEGHPFVDVLVAQTLDDLDESRFDVAQALRGIAGLAWLDGFRRGAGLGPDAADPGSARWAREARPTGEIRSTGNGE